MKSRHRIFEFLLHGSARLSLSGPRGIRITQPDRRWLRCRCIGLFLAVCQECRLSWAVRNCTRDEGGPVEFCNQVLISSHRKPLSSKATVVNVAQAS